MMAVFAQALIEKGMLDGLATEFSMLMGQLRASVEDGRIVYVLIVIALLVLFHVSTKRS
jgi:hypothetical protein